jgi:hypothetical protein
VLGGVVQVDVHLARIGVGEAAELEVDQHQATQAAVVEDQVNAEPVVADAKAPLASNETEVTAELQQERVEVADERVLEVGLGVLVFEAEELKDVRVLDLLRGRQAIVGLDQRALLEHQGLVTGQSGAFVELAVDLPIQLTHRPPTAQGLSLVEAAGLLALHREEAHVGRPR